MKLIEFFDRGVALGEERPCLIDAGGTRSFGEVRDFSHRFGAAARRAGLGPGTPFAVLSPNQSIAFEAILGGLRAGAIWVPANARAAAEELVHILTLTGARALFYAVASSGLVAEVAPQCPQIGILVRLDGDGPLPVGHLALADWMAGVPDRMEPVEFPDDELVALSATGGTTGLPKAVMSTHRIWTDRIAATCARIDIGRPPMMLCAAPISHAAGAFTLETLAMGTTTVILPGFDPQAVAAAIEQHRITHMFLPPTAIYRMLATPGVEAHDFSSLRYVTTASSAISPEKLREAIELFGPAMEPAYGATEMGMSVCSYQPDALAADIAAGLEDRLQSCGRVCEGTELAIMDPDGTLLETGQSGEVVVRGPQVTTGYFRNPAETDKAIRDGWYHSGDVGFLDEDGYLYIRDRVKEMIISGGFNIYPAEVERVLHAQPAVQDCGVIGVPDPDWGEKVVAVVELRPGMTATPEELIAACRARLTHYKVPKAVEFGELPRSPVGKVLRRALRDRYWQGRERAI